MEMKTFPITVKDGHVYAEVTLRDVVEKTDVSDLPILSEIKRLYEENANLREEAESWRRLTWGLELPEYPFNRLRWEELERENAKLRKLAVGMYGMLEMFDTLLGNHDACETPRPLVFGEDKSFKDAMRELGVEVPDGEV